MISSKIIKTNMERSSQSPFYCRDFLFWAGEIVLESRFHLSEVVVDEEERRLYADLDPLFAMATCTIHKALLKNEFMKSDRYYFLMAFWEQKKGHFWWWWRISNTFIMVSKTISLEKMPDFKDGGEFRILETDGWKILKCFRFNSSETFQKFVVNKSKYFST